MLQDVLPIGWFRRYRDREPRSAVNLDDDIGVLERHQTGKRPVAASVTGQAIQCIWLTHIVERWQFSRVYFVKCSYGT